MPVREVVRETTETVRAVAAPVVEISAPETASSSEAGGSIERTVRVLPQADGTEAIRLDLHLDDEQLDVTVTPRTPVAATPIRLQLPSLLEGLPSIDVTVVDGASATADRPGLGRTPCGPRRWSLLPGPSTVAPNGSRPSAPPAPSRAPRRRPSGPPASPSRTARRAPIPTGITSAAGMILAVLGVLGLRAASAASSIVHRPSAACRSPRPSGPPSPRTDRPPTGSLRSHEGLTEPR